MRSERIATCTSADPVSPSVRAWVLIRSALRSAIIDIGFSRICVQMEDTCRAQLPGPHLAERRRLAAGRGQNGPGRVQPADGSRGEKRPQGFDLTRQKDDR